VDLTTGAAVETVRLPHRFTGGKDMSAMTRGQPHPAWSPCGRRLAVNCNHGGERMGLLLLTDFLPE
jgi:hypothetical protein